MSNIRLGSIALDCADTAELSSFWADLLGGEIAFSSDEFAAVRTDRIWLAATQVEGHTPPTWPDGRVPSRSISTWPSTTSPRPSSGRCPWAPSVPRPQPAPDRYLVLLDPAGHPFCLSTQIPD